MTDADIQSGTITRANGIEQTFFTSGALSTYMDEANVFCVQIDGANTTQVIKAIKLEYIDISAEL